ncbi:MAG: GNAT family N-acetyltransferase [Solirubrobacterales bacterium]|nr:GNAT family N-acetyltransferase [Solirubrobacterales bacterium]
MFRPSYPIETERLSLRPFEPGDFDAVYAIHSRADVARYLPWRPRDADGVRGALEQKLTRAELIAEGDALNLAAVLRADGALVGDCTLFWLSREHRRGEVGFIFHPDHHGKGLAREAAEAMLRVGFEGLGLHRIIGRLDARNSASARVLERLGMRREAHLVENELVKGEWCDELVYALLRAEWEKSRG